MTKQSDPILERAKYYADKIYDDTMLESEALGIGATLSVGETNIIMINLLTRILNLVEGSNAG